ncbi:hypothetical protein D3C73_1059650 [compost metagenome]
MSTRETLIEKVEEFQEHLENFTSYISRNSVHINNWVDIETANDLANELHTELTSVVEAAEDIDDEAAHWTKGNY